MDLARCSRAFPSADVAFEEGNKYGPPESTSGFWVSSPLEDAVTRLQTFNTLNRRRFLSRAAPGILGAAAVSTGAPALPDHRAAAPGSGDWPRFTSALAAALAELEAADFLILRCKDQPYYVQFCGDTAALRVEAVSDQCLGGGARLSTRSHHALVTAGWTPPWHVPHGPGSRPDRPPNYFMDIPHPVAFGDVAALAVRTLQDAYEVAHPTSLTYKAGAPDGTVIKFPTLGIARRPPRAGRSTRRTTAEQELLDWFARHRGREWTEDSSELILGQARHIGDL